MGMFLPGMVYLLCFLSSSLCAVLLLRRYFLAGMRLLLWSGACFLLLALNNLLVVVDLLILTDIDLRPARLWMSLIAVCTLLYGFIWELED